MSRFFDRYIHAVDVLLRVPYLLIIDTVLSSRFSQLYNFLKSNTSNNNLTEHNQNMTVENTLQIPYGAFLVLVFIVFPAAVLFSLLLTRHLVQTYSLLMSALAIWFSYQQNWELAQIAIQDRENIAISHRQSINNTTIILNSLIQCACSLIFNACFLAIHWHGEGAISRVIRCLFKCGCMFAAHVPILFVCLDQNDIVIRRSPALAVIYPLCLVGYVTVRNGEDLYNFFVNGSRLVYQYIRSFGVQSFVETHWQRLDVPTVLKVFWCSKVTYIIYLTSPALTYDLTFLSALWITVRDAMFVRGCENFLSLAGLTAMVSSLCKYLVYLMARIVKVEDDTEWHYGTVSAILFFLLALQNGVTNMHPEPRRARLYRNICLLSMAMLHFVHSMVKDVLMNLSTMRQFSITRHLRPLIMCAFLVSSSVIFLIFLWSQNSYDAWTLAVTAFGVEVVIKVVFTLIQYGLFMIDAFMDGVWTGLDDYIYWAKSLGNSIEFVFGVLLFTNGVWIFLFESGGAIRAVMICIHAYFNIYLQGKSGWRTFKNRRMAVSRIQSLPNATPTELSILSDVCPVCYSEMRVAKVTPCGHYYHPMCLRKWVYIRDTCPMCHRALFPDNDGSQDEPLEWNNHRIHAE